MAAGAFRMRGIGKGQTIHLYIIPEIERLMARELKQARMPSPRTLYYYLCRVKVPMVAYRTTTGVDVDAKVLVDVAAWLVVNSMRSERIQVRTSHRRNLCCPFTLVNHSTVQSALHTKCFQRMA